MANEALERLRAENAVLRALLAKLARSCHYCGVEDFSQCASGFPGCSLADDLLLGKDEAFKAWALRTKRRNGGFP